MPGLRVRTVDMRKMRSGSGKIKASVSGTPLLDTITEEVYNQAQYDKVGQIILLYRSTIISRSGHLIMKVS